jgi:hypothetical protein
VISFRLNQNFAGPQLKKERGNPVVQDDMALNPIRIPPWRQAVDTPSPSRWDHADRWAKCSPPLTPVASFVVFASGCATPASNILSERPNNPIYMFAMEPIDRIDKR